MAGAGASGFYGNRDEVETAELGRMGEWTGYVVSMDVRAGTKLCTGEHHASQIKWSLRRTGFRWWALTCKVIMSRHPHPLAAATAVILLVVLLGGCVSPPEVSRTIEGQWHFAHVGKARSLFGEFPAPPRFDSIRFEVADQIVLESRLLGESFEGTYAWDGNNVDYQFQPPDMPTPVKHRLNCELSDNGRALILTHDGTEMIYRRSEWFGPITVAGEWRSANDANVTLRLGRDGSLNRPGDSIFGHFRVWQSRYGQTMTAISFVQNEGVFMFIWQYKHEGDRLTLIPISWKGLLEDQASHWVLADGAEAE